MAKFTEIDQAAFTAWVATQPKSMQALITKLPPDRLYLLKSTGHRVTIDAYCDDGTVVVIVCGQFNALTFDRKVFGIDPNHLEECDLPAAGEPLGTILTHPDEVNAYFDSIRPAVLAERAINKASGKGRA